MMESRVIIAETLFKEERNMMDYGIEMWPRGYLMNMFHLSKGDNYYLLNIYIYIYIYISKVDNHSRGWLESSPFNSYYPEVLWIAPLYLIMLSVKQGGIKYHFLYDSTWAIGERSTH